MNRRRIISEDGSESLFSEDFGETYHSTSGALQETQYIFIKNGLLRRIASLEPLDVTSPIQLNILEYGFGTGLNILLSIKEMLTSLWKQGISIHVCTLEKYPLLPEEYNSLNYGEGEIREYYLSLHEAPWGVTVPISEGLEIHKILCDFKDFQPTGNPFDNSTKHHLPSSFGKLINPSHISLPWIDLVFFDAFSPSAQPEVWTPEILTPMASAMKSNAVFVTYSSKGSVKQALRDAGLDVHRIPGAGGKRHSIVAIKL